MEKDKIEAVIKCKRRRKEFASKGPRQLYCSNRCKCRCGCGKKFWMAPNRIRRKENLKKILDNNQGRR